MTTPPICDRLETTVRAARIVAMSARPRPITCALETARSGPRDDRDQAPLAARAVNAYANDLPRHVATAE